MYEYKNSEFVVSGTEHWVAWPVRPRRQLVARFVGTVVLLPFWAVLGVAIFAGTLAIGLVSEVISAVSSSYEKAFDRFMDKALGRVFTLPRWCVLWSEMRYEGDAAHYRAEVDKLIAKWTARATAPSVPNKSRPISECEIPRRAYRGCGGHYVVRTATAQGWELRPSEPEKSVRLWWSASS
ncbi:hypothetical protein [Streptomyces sp. NPDC020607]|uniref:hypothetical protein n=1 Tax=Streptomyces sp. NPDC020607 TaxID=3365082 RepID=UPI0037B08D67